MLLPTKDAVYYVCCYNPCYWYTVSFPSSPQFHLTHSTPLRSIPRPNTIASLILHLDLRIAFVYRAETLAVSTASPPHLSQIFPPAINTSLPNSLPPTLSLSPLDFPAGVCVPCESMSPRISCLLSSLTTPPSIPTGWYPPAPTPALNGDLSDALSFRP